MRRAELRSDQPLSPAATPAYRLITSYDDLRTFYGVSSLRLWPADADWSKEVVLIAERGEYPTGGYTVSITGLRAASKAGTMVASVAFGNPSPSDFVTLAFTSPRDAVIVSREDLAGVSRLEFVREDNGEVLAPLNGVNS